MLYIACALGYISRLLVLAVSPNNDICAVCTSSILSPEQFLMTSPEPLPMKFNLTLVPVLHEQSWQHVHQRYLPGSVDLAQAG